MNDNTYKLLEQLANKFGTTTEYLWGVLVRQAAIDATIQLIQTIVILWAAFFLCKLHKKFKKNGTYDKYDIGAELPMVLISIVVGILVIVAFVSSGNIFNGYFNPEYWALDKILSSAKD